MLEERGLADSGLAAHEDERAAGPAVDARKRLGEHGELVLPLEQRLLRVHGDRHAHIVHRLPSRGKNAG